MSLSQSPSLVVPVGAAADVSSPAMSPSTSSRVRAMSRISRPTSPVKARPTRGGVCRKHLRTPIEEANDDRRLLNLQKKLSRLKLLIIDELGFVPLSKAGAELLLEVFSQRYEGGSILITTNLPFDESTEVFSLERLTGVQLNLLTHHVHIPQMNGESYRL